MKIGIGYDVHKLVEGRKLILGGVDIPYEKGLEGHSDADVLVHAIIDAILGAAKLGDIGKLFPDTDQKFKNANSIEMLKEVIKKTNKVLDVDSIIIAQAPKMAPYIDQMKNNLENIIGCKVGVKATTTEHLSFEGRGEGISAQAVCLMED